VNIYNFNRHQRVTSYPVNAASGDIRIPLLWIELQMTEMVG